MLHLLGHCEKIEKAISEMTFSFWNRQLPYNLDFTYFLDISQKSLIWSFILLFAYIRVFVFLRKWCFGKNQKFFKNFLFQLPTTFEDGKMKFYILRNTPQSDLVIIDILNNLPKPYHFGSFFLKNRRHFFKFFAVYFMLWN